MRIKQALISNSVSTFKNAYLNKFDLVDAYSHSEPVLLIGLYSDDDYLAFHQFNKKIVVLWCGTDAMMITPERAKLVKSPGVTHIVKSQFMSDDLAKFDIPHKIIPVSWQEHDIEPMPLGTAIFHYGDSRFYGSHKLDEIERATGLHIYKTGKDTFSKEDLLKVYRECFIGLRLTRHDGLPNTVLELGMMGRRSIYNGGIPTAIKWDSIGSIINSILTEYHNRKTADYKGVSDQIKKHINISDKWLRV
jgi:hypothetical protein